jgi:hypothetical protein
MAPRQDTTLVGRTEERVQAAAKLMSRRPDFAGKNIADVRGGHSVLGGKFRLANPTGGKARTDLIHLSSGQLSTTMPFSSCRVLRMRVSGVLGPYRSPAFGFHIKRVFGSRSKEQMRGTNACRGIAMMANEQPVLDGTVLGRPAVAWGTNAGAINPTDPIAIAINAAGPEPTRPQIGTPRWNRTILIDFGPEADMGRDSLRQSRAALRAVGPRLVGVREGRSALGTGKLIGHREPCTRGVTPRAVCTSAGATCVSIVAG